MHNGKITMSESANALASLITGEDTTPNTTDPIVEDEESQVDEELDGQEDETTEEETDGEDEQEELPDAVKEILKKNRKAVREAEARALAAEKALAAKDSTETPEPTEADTKFKDLYLNSAAKSALVEAGITTGTDRFLKMLDLSAVEVDESGTISGLDDQIADLKEEWADILAPKPARKSTGKVDGARREAPAVPKSSAELLASRIAG